MITLGQESLPKQNCCQRIIKWSYGPRHLEGLHLFSYQIIFAPEVNQSIIFGICQDHHMMLIIIILERKKINIPMRVFKILLVVKEKNLKLNQNTCQMYIQTQSMSIPHNAVQGSVELSKPALVPERVSLWEQRQITREISPQCAM